VEGLLGTIWGGVGDVIGEMEVGLDHVDRDKVGCITVARQVSVKAQRIKDMTKAIDFDSEGRGSKGGERVVESCTDLVQKCARFEKHLFKNWCEDTSENLDDDNLKLSMTGQLMEIDNHGILQVNYKEELVILLRQTRALTEMGFAIPSEIQKQALQAEKYYRFGIMLKKVSEALRPPLCSHLRPFIHPCV